MWDSSLDLPKVPVFFMKFSRGFFIFLNSFSALCKSSLVHPVLRFSLFIDAFSLGNTLLYGFSGFGKKRFLVRGHIPKDEVLFFRHNL